MKILILTEGGRHTGFGHITRCLALYEAFKLKGAKPRLVANGDKTITAILGRCRYQIFNWTKEKKRLAGLISGSNVVLVDSYLASGPLYGWIYKKIYGDLVVIDDLNRKRYTADMIINPSLYGNGLDHANNKNALYLSGKDYVIVRKEFWNIPEKKIGNDMKDVLVTLGGSRHPGLMNKIVTTLKKQNKYRLTVIEAGKKRFTAKEMLSFLLKTDLCITAGGQTLHELARVGVPAVGICLADNQIMNLKAAEKKGFIKYAGSSSDKRLFSRIGRSLSSVAGHAKRMRMSDLAKACVDGKGAKRIADAVLKRYSPGIFVRKARKNDCRDIWQWRNHPAVRKWCYDRKPIKFSDHKKWFETRLNSNRVSMFIAENENGQKIGQVRFDGGRGSSFTININLNPVFIGKGLGASLISLSTRRFLSSHPQVKKITAEIVIGNEASQRAFHKAGFRLRKKTLYEYIR